VTIAAAALGSCEREERAFRPDPVATETQEPVTLSSIPDEQMWQIAAYVRSMGRYVPSGAAPSRDDRLHPRPAENRLPAGEPKSGNIPAGAEQP